VSNALENCRSDPAAMPLLASVTNSRRLTAICDVSGLCAVHIWMLTECRGYRRHQPYYYFRIPKWDSIIVNGDLAAPEGIVGDTPLHRRWYQSQRAHSGRSAGEAC